MVPSHVVTTHTSDALRRPYDLAQLSQPPTDSYQPTKEKSRDNYDTTNLKTQRTRQSRQPRRSKRDKQNKRNKRNDEKKRQTTRNEARNREKPRTQTGTQTRSPGTINSGNSRHNKFPVVICPALQLSCSHDISFFRNSFFEQRQTYQLRSRPKLVRSQPNRDRQKDILGNMVSTPLEHRDID